MRSPRLSATPAAHLVFPLPEGARLRFLLLHPRSEVQRGQHTQDAHKHRALPASSPLATTAHDLGSDRACTRHVRNLSLDESAPFAASPAPGRQPSCWTPAVCGLPKAPCRPGEGMSPLTHRETESGAQVRRVQGRVVMEGKSVGAPRPVSSRHRPAAGRPTSSRRGHRGSMGNLPGGHWRQCGHGDHLHGDAPGRPGVPCCPQITAPPTPQEPRGHLRPHPQGGRGRHSWRKSGTHQVGS